MNPTLPATQVRQQFFRLLEKTETPGNTVTITIGGEPKVVMMAFEDFEGWQETLEIMSDKNLMLGIKKALKEAEKGEVYSVEEVKKKLKI